MLSWFLHFYFIEIRDMFFKSMNVIIYMYHILLLSYKVTRLIKIPPF